MHRVRSVSLMKHAQRRLQWEWTVTVARPPRLPIHTQQQSTLRARPVFEEPVAHFGRESDDANVIPVRQVRLEVNVINSGTIGGRQTQPQEA